MKQKQRMKNATPEQRRKSAAIHKEAVRLRKLSDELLVRAASAKAASLMAASAEKRESPAVSRKSPLTCAGGVLTGRDTNGVKTLLTALEEGRCMGVKGATTYKIATLAREMGLV